MEFSETPAAKGYPYIIANPVGAAATELYFLHCPHDLNSEYSAFLLHLHSKGIRV